MICSTKDESEEGNQNSSMYCSQVKTYCADVWGEMKDLNEDEWS